MHAPIQSHAEMIASQAQVTHKMITDVLEVLYPGYGQIMSSLRHRPDLLKLIAAQIALGPSNSVAPSNVANNGFGGI